MKPIRLKMTAFGPYKDEEVIDFTKLQERKLFVISGVMGCRSSFGEMFGVCMDLHVAEINMPVSVPSLKLLQDRRDFFSCNAKPAG